MHAAIKIAIITSLPDLPPTCLEGVAAPSQEPHPHPLLALRVLVRSLYFLCGSTPMRLSSVLHRIRHNCNKRYWWQFRLSVRLSVCSSHAGVVYKRLNVSSKFFHCLTAPAIIQIFGYHISFGNSDRGMGPQLQENCQ